MSFPQLLPCAVWRHGTSLSHSSGAPGQLSRHPLAQAATPKSRCGIPFDLHKWQGVGLELSSVSLATTHSGIRCLEAAALRFS